MDYQSISIIIVASLIGLVYLLKIRNVDIYEKEPFWKLLMVAIFGGIISVIASLILYEFVDVQHNFVDAIIKIGFIEELSKLLALMALVSFIKNDFNEIADGVIYITAIALGFAIIENIFYTFNYNNSYTLLFQRSIFAVMGHISFSGYMGLAYYIHKRVHKNYLGIILSVILAALAHGLYDGVLFEEVLNPIFNIVFIILIILQYRLFKALLGFSKFRQNMSKDIFVKTQNTLFLYCCKCDKSLKSNEFEFQKIKIGYCDSCGNAIVNSDNIFHMIEYYRPTLKPSKFLKRINKTEKITFLDEGKKVYFHTQRTYLSSEINDLAGWLNNSNSNDEKKILNIPILGSLIKLLGIRYISN